jgi:restriction endonuclease S subunit
MKQLLKPNALAAIILPSTILSNAGNYEKARELILSNFELKAILNIGQGGFMETGTSTVTLFLKKLNNTLLLSNKEDYKKMTIDKKLLIVNSGEKEVEKNFLGYEFSKRRGTEGLKKLDSNLLYNEDDRFDEQYANSYILKSMLNYDYIPINDKLKNHISLISLTDCFNWDREVFSNSMQLKKKLQIKSNYKLEKLGNVTYIKKGNTITEETADLTGNIPVIAGGKISPYNHSKSNYKGNIITISASGEAGYVWYHDYPIWASDCFVLSSSNEKNISTKYIFYILEYLQDTIYSLQSGIAQKHVYEKDIINLEIPIANFKIQENIIKFLEEQELNIQEYKSKSTILEKNIDDIEIPQSNYMRLEKLNNLQFGIGKRILKNKIANQGYYPIYSANVFVPFGYKNQLLNKNISGLDFSNFSNSSIIWGIDGDWMVNYIEKEKPFVPTDHCGILRVTNDSICNTKYLSHVIKIAGEKAGFSRSYRASIDRIKQLEIPYIDIKSQNIIASKIIEYEFEISRLKELIQKAKIKQKKFIKDILDLEIL